MTSCISKKNIKLSFDHLFSVISGKRFLRKQGLDNEVPFFICPFDIDVTVEVGKFQLGLVNRLEQVGVIVLMINIYDLSIEILRDRGIWDQVLEKENSVSKDELNELLQGVLHPEEHLTPAIATKLKNNEFDVLILIGVGEVFPYIRSHNVLNNLQRAAKEKPTVMFFPGAYTHTPESGSSLDLFGRLRDDKYYRAYNIFHIEA